MNGGLKPVATPGDGDDFCMVEDPIEDGAGGRNIVEQFAPFFDRAIGGHQSGAIFITAHDDLQEDFAALNRENFESHVIDDEQVGFEIFGQQAAFTSLGLFGEEFAHEIEDGAVKNEEAGFDGLLTDGLGEMTFTHSGRTNKKHIAALTQEVAGSELIDASD